MLKTTIVIALGLVFIDAFILNSYIVAFLTANVVIVMGVRIAYKYLKLLLTKKGDTVTRQQLFIVGIFTLVVVTIVAANNINNRIAKSRAESLIACCDKYKQKHGEYPNELTDLVPEYIGRVPLAKYTLNFNKFWYISIGGSHSLFFVESPPYGRPTYLFEKHRWTYID